MPNTTVVERYQVAGLDERERGFSRLTDVEQVDGAYQAVLRYESTIVRTQSCDTSASAIKALIEVLKVRGYTQLRSRLNFRGSIYLGSQEPWVEYPDQGQLPGAQDVTEQLARRSGWIGWVLSLLAARES